MLRKLMLWLGILKSYSLEDELQTISKRYEQAEQQVKPPPKKKVEYTIKLRPNYSGGYWLWAVYDPTGKMIKEDNQYYETKMFARKSAEKWLKAFHAGKTEDEGITVFKVQL
jgi:hypothetical protein